MKLENFILGAKSAFCLNNIIFDEKKEKSDTEILAEDWKIIGNDIQTSINNFDDFK